MNKALSVVLCAFLITCGCSQKPESVHIQPPLLGSITGRVFAITVGGDLKPARLAEVILLNMNSDAGRAAEATEADLEKDTEKWTHLGADYERHELSAVARNAFQACAQLVDIDREGMADEIKKAASSNMGNQGQRSFSTETDEEGNFQIDQIPAGKYFLKTNGHAGSYVSVWVTTVELAAGQKINVKLSSPATSCSTLY